MRIYLIGATAAATFAAAATPAAAAITFANALTVAGDAVDASSRPAGANNSRLSFGSDLFYDRATKTYYGAADRGAGGGTLPYDTRFHTFRLNVDATTGAVSNFAIKTTSLLTTAGGGAYNGLAPTTASVLGNSLDPEGIVRLASGNVLISDEYGPSIIEFTAAGAYVRTFTNPANIVPKAGATPDYLNGRPTITTGRQDNRGFEGLTLSPDGTTAYAILQDPLVNEGASNDGRRSQNLRIVRYDVATGTATGQFVYQLESLADINGRIPGTADDFSPTAQGRNIGVSSITAIGGGKFLVIERDNRGLGVGDPTGTGAPIGSKRVFLIDLAGATDVSGISLAGSNSLPGGVTPVSKMLFIDLQARLNAAGVTIAEKIEGLTIGPRLHGGGVSLLLASDNDFSVTQNSSNVQFDVCTSGLGGVTTTIALDAACPAGQRLIPTYVYAFAVTGADAAALGFGAVPEPGSWAMLIAGFGLTGAAIRRRRAAVAA